MYSLGCLEYSHIILLSTQGNARISFSLSFFFGRKHTAETIKGNANLLAVWEGSKRVKVSTCYQQCLDENVKSLSVVMFV